MKKNQLVPAILIFAGVVILAIVVLSSLTPRGTTVTQTPVANADNPVDFAQNGEEDTIEATGELVDGFPEFPLYPNSTIERSFETARNNVYDYQGFFEVNAKRADVINYYNNLAKKSAWKVDAYMNPALDEQLLKATINGKKVQIMVEDGEESGTEYTVTFTN